MATTRYALSFAALPAEEQEAIKAHQHLRVVPVNMITLATTQEIGLGITRPIAYFFTMI